MSRAGSGVCELTNQRRAGVHEGGPCKPILVLTQNQYELVNKHNMSPLITILSCYVCLLVCNIVLYLLFVTTGFTGLFYWYQLFLF